MRDGATRNKVNRKKEKPFHADLFCRLIEIDTETASFWESQSSKYVISR
jgi:hypothetical protein